MPATMPISKLSDTDTLICGLIVRSKSVLLSFVSSIKEIILCQENKSDVEEIKADYLKGLTFHYVKEMSEVLAIAITKEDAKNAKKF